MSQPPQWLTDVCGSSHDRPQRNCPVAQPDTHAPVIAEHTGVAAEHALPHRPHDVVAVSDASQPLAALMSQSAKPMLQVIPHVPIVHVAVELAASGHVLPHAPQLAALVRVLVSQPLTALPSQSAKPSAQAVWHRPIAHEAVAFGPAVQTVPQAPQFMVLARVSVSQPLAALRSQSAKPASHTSPHAPIRHARVAWTPAAHAMPHMPQWFASDCGSTHSAPHRSCPLAQPVPHTSAPSVVRVQSGVPPAHAMPHMPQFELPLSAASQPLAALVSQSANPAAQASPQRPIAHVAVEFSPAMHTVVHEPQCVGSALTSRHIPPQHAWLIGHACSEVQPATQSPRRHTSPAGQWSSVTQRAQTWRARSQRSMPPSPAQSVSAPQPVSQRLAAVQYSFARQSPRCVGVHGTHWPVAVSHT
jgi:hypothetical protein